MPFGLIELVQVSELRGPVTVPLVFKADVMIHPPEPSNVMIPTSRIGKDKAPAENPQLSFRDSLVNGGVVTSAMTDTVPFVTLAT